MIQTPSRIFILSPANCGGKRAQILMSESAQFELARELRSGTATLGQVFSFLSGLYFRGKLTYAKRFASPPDGMNGVFVITPNAGLRSPDEPIKLDQLKSFAGVDVHESNPSYRKPVEIDAHRIASLISRENEVVLLGSIATAKYVEVLTSIFRERLKFPADFIGRGDMSRGGLLLRCVDSATELDYIGLSNGSRHGPRPPKLEKR
jgi:hypothetical protein